MWGSRGGDGWVQTPRPFFLWKNQILIKLKYPSDPPPLEKFSVQLVMYGNVFAIHTM